MSSLRRPTRGFTLTELAIVLGIIGIVLGAIWAASAKVHDSHKVGRAVQETLAVAQNVRAAYGAKRALDSGNLSQVAVNMNLYPSDMLASGSCAAYPGDGAGVTPCPLHPWNGEMSVGSGSSGWACPTASCGTDTFLIVLWGMTNTECSAFFSALLPEALSTGLIGIYSDAQGSTAVSATTPMSDTHIVNCSGNIDMQFRL